MRDNSKSIIKISQAVKNIEPPLSTEDYLLIDEAYVKSLGKYFACLKKNKPELADFFIKEKNSDRVLYMVAWLQFFKELIKHEVDFKHLGLSQKIECGLLGNFLEKVMISRGVDAVLVVKNKTYARRVANIIRKKFRYPWNDKRYPQNVDVKKVIADDRYASVIAKKIISRQP